MKSETVTSKHELFKYDDMYALDVPGQYFDTFKKLVKISSKKKALSLKQLESAFTDKLKDFIVTLLGQSRIATVDVRNRSKHDDSQGSDSDSSFFVGLTFGDKWADPIMRGPSANTEEGKKFRADFENMSEIRKFADNALCESVCWIGTDENNVPNDDLGFSIVERYLNLICYKKLQLPVGSLRKLFVWPDKWISIIPRAQLPPSFLQNAYHDLAKHLRKVEVLSLGIVGVNCVSSHYRDTEPFRLCPAPALWRRSKGGNFYQHLNESEKIPRFTASVKVFITLERTGKWGKNPETIESYKTACYIELAKEFFGKHSAIANEKSVLILMNGVIFKLVIVHDDELRQYQELSTEFSTDLTSMQLTAQAHEATVCQQLQSMSQRFTAFGETCQVAKRWLSASNFSGHLNEIAIELLVAKCFIEPGDRFVESITPMSVTAGFLQFLRLLASHNFLEEPIFVDMNESLKDEDKDEISQEFLKRRPVLPCICLSTPEDRAGIRYTASGPEPIVMCRLVQIAQQAINTIVASLRTQNPINYRQLCVEDNSVYDLVVILYPDKSTHFVQNNSYTQSIQQQSAKTKGGKRAIAIPVVDFDLTKCLIDEYCSKLGKYAIFFYDKYDSKRICVLYRKNFRSPNKKELVDNAKHFECSENLIYLHRAFKKQLVILGTGLVKMVNSLFEESDEITEKVRKRKLSELEHVEPVIEVPAEKKQRKSNKIKY